jgi:hypothetical protein
MVRIEYQLTFEEYREGFLAAQRRFINSVKTEQRRSWRTMASAVGVGVAFTLAFRYFVSRPNGWYDARAHVFWIAMFAVLFVLMLLLARKQRRDVARRVWDDLPILQQLKHVTFDEGGVRSDSPLMQTFATWAAYKAMEETPRVFLLFMSDLAVEVFPKRAITSPELEELRELVQRKLAAPTRGFPVIAAGASS